MNIFQCIPMNWFIRLHGFQSSPFILFTSGDHGPWSRKKWTLIQEIVDPYPGDHGPLSRRSWTLIQEVNDAHLRVHWCLSGPAVEHAAALTVAFTIRLHHLSWTSKSDDMDSSSFLTVFILPTKPGNWIHITFPIIGPLTWQTLWLPRDWLCLMCHLSSLSKSIISPQWNLPSSPSSVCSLRILGHDQLLTCVLPLLGGKPPTLPGGVGYLIWYSVLPVPHGRKAAPGGCCQRVIE